MGIAESDTLATGGAMPASCDHVELKRQLSSAKLCSEDTISSWKSIFFPHSADKRDEQLSKAATARETKQKSGRHTNMSPVTANPARAQGAVNIYDGGSNVLSAQQAVVLATEAANILLKTLTDAATELERRKPASGRMAQHCKDSSTDLHMRQGMHDELDEKRLANTQLRERSGNRPPAPSCKSQKQTKQRCNSDTGPGSLHLAECGRLIFAFLAANASSKKTANPPEYRLENAMLSFINKLMLLDFQDLVFVELQTLYHVINQHLRLNESHERAQSANIPVAGTSSKSLPLTHPEEMLRFQISGHTPPALVYLTISFQIAVLRVISRNPQLELLQSMQCHLDPGLKTSSVAALATYSQLADWRDKAFKSIQNLAQLVWQSATLPLQRVKSNTDSTPEQRFRLQTLSLRIRSCLSATPDQEAEISCNVLESFVRCALSFPRLCSKSASEKFILVRDMYKSVQDCVSKNTTGRDPATHTINALLSVLALEANLPEESQRFADVVRNNQALVPNMKLCAWSSRLATIELKRIDMANGFAFRLEPVQDAVNFMTTDLSGRSMDFDDAVHAVYELSKSAARTIQRSVSPCKDYKKLSNMLHSVLISSANVFIRYYSIYVTQKAQSPNKEANLLAKISPMSKSEVQFILLSLKTRQMNSDITWLTVSEALQVCWSMLQMFRDLSGPEKDLNHDTNPEDWDVLCVRISDAYWSFYFQTDVTTTFYPQDVRIIALKRSCEILEQSSACVKLKGRLPMKLCKLGRILEENGEFRQARDVFVASIAASRSIGVLSEVLSQMRVKPLHTVVDGSEPMLLIGSTIKSLVNVIVDRKEASDPGKGFYDDESFNLEERAALLEWQLMILLRREKRQHDHKVSQICLHLGGVLLGLYDAKRFPLRRRHVLIDLLQLEESEQNMEVVNQAKETILPLASGELDQDQGLYDYQDDLEASLTICTTIKNQSRVQAGMVAAIKIWAALIRSCGTLEDLSGKILTVEGLTSQLEMISIYADVQGWERLRLCSLALLFRVYDLSHRTGSNDRTATLICMALQYLRLGHSSQASLFLARARNEQKNGESSSNLSLHFAVADLELSTILCDFQKW